VDATPAPSSAAADGAADGPVVLFDGECNLCHGAVQFIVRRDPRARFRFAALQSAAAARLLAAAGAGPIGDTMALVQGGAVHVRSGAALRIARGLRFPWPLLAVFLIVPAPLRDLVYRFVARHRFRWFGRRELCWLPTPALRARFLDDAERPP
jgi:predicted DCC family thiol-disulfide oxidoreductase YuxK